jgi:HSP20 family protein
MDMKIDARTQTDARNTGEERLAVFRPPADVFETPAAVWIHCEMPGVAGEDLEVVLENRVLTVTGRQMGQGREGFAMLAGEYRTGVYQRSFALPKGVDESALRARLKDGVLEIELPKAVEARPRRIPVES